MQSSPLPVHSLYNPIFHNPVSFGIGMRFIICTHAPQKDRNWLIILISTQVQPALILSFIKCFCLATANYLVFYLKPVKLTSLKVNTGQRSSRGTLKNEAVDFLWAGCKLRQTEKEAKPIMVCNLTDNARWYSGGGESNHNVRCKPRKS